ncbi:hypothetical protein [Kineococcus sp. SYSU DK003]|uniref:hypothetical protein n=1 Tax=Kineococcus sp. SYSU DK003 TaxID=3383124 RepID=UPI003D7D5B6C
MQRRTFLGTSTAGLAAVATTTYAAAPAAAQEVPAVDEQFAARLLAAAEAQVDAVLAGREEQLTQLWAHRAWARSALRLTSVLAAERSRHHRSAELLAPLASFVSALRAAQHRDGTWDQGNLHTPPDSAFVVNDLCPVLDLLQRDDWNRTRDVREELRTVLALASDALVVGGVHTPNHRWEISSALARLHALVPRPGQLERIGEWLAEGVDIDADGQYSERSPNYAFAVTNPSLLTIARLTDRVELRAHVRRNLDLHLLCLEDDGTLETVQSRRQDQKEVRDSSDALMVYREMAIRDGDGRYARFVLDQLARTDEPARAADGDAWAEVLAHPDVAAPLPAPVPLGTEGTHVLAGSGLVRYRRGSSTASVFGGADLVDDPDRPGAIASGLATNPTFLRFRHGAAVLSSVRFAPRFFSWGHFRSQGIEVGDDGTVTLRQNMTGGYYQPLPPAARRGSGEYDLELEGRFWAAMSFSEREREARVLETTVVVRPVGGNVENGFDLEFTVGGTEEPGDVPATVELAFLGDGTLEGTEVLDAEAGTHQLVAGWGSWRVGDDEVRFGPGTGSGPRQPAVVDPGERYTWLGGDVVPAGTRVLLTTTVPGSWTLSIR